MFFPCACYMILAFLMFSGLAGASPAVAAQATVPSGLDPVSSACVTCHDGADAPHAGFCLLTQQEGTSGGHLVSASYAELAANNRDLRPPSSLPPQLALTDGLITCATCHGGDPHEGTALVIDNAGSALCQACHLK